MTAAPIDRKRLQGLLEALEDRLMTLEVEISTDDLDLYVYNRLDEIVQDLIALRDDLEIELAPILEP